MEKTIDNILEAMFSGVNLGIVNLIFGIICISVGVILYTKNKKTGSVILFVLGVLGIVGALINFIL